VPLAFDTTGLQRHDERTWFDPRTGDQVSLTYFDLEPDLPASLEELPLLRQRLAHVLAEAGTLVEAHVVTIDSVPALYQVVKLPIPGRQTGLMFVAALTVPKATGSVVLQVLCQEGNTSGIRESMVSAQIGFENCFPPHPYAPGLQGVLPWNVADDQRWDAQFPEHPLSRARVWAHRTIRTARVDPNFARLPPFRPTAQEPPAFGGPGDSQHFAPPEPQTFGAPADSQHSTAPDAFDAPPEPQTLGGPSDSQRFAPPTDSQRFAPPGTSSTPPEQQPFGAPADTQHSTTPDPFTAPPQPQTFAGPSDSQRFAPPGTSGTPPEPQTLGGPSDSQRFAPPGTSSAPPEQQTLGAPTDSQHTTTPDPFSTPPEPQTFAGPSDSQRFAPPTDSQRFAPPDSFGGPADSQHSTAPDAFGTPPEPQTFAGPSDSQRFAAPDSFGAPSEQQTFGGPADSQHSTTPDPFSAPPEPQTFAGPSDSQRFAPPTDSQHFAPPDTSSTPPEPQTFAGPTDSQRFAPPSDSPRPAAPDTPGAPSEPQTSADSQRFAAPGSLASPEPQEFAAPSSEARAFTAPKAVDAPEQLDLPRKPRPYPVSREPAAFDPPESVGLPSESEQVDAAPEPEPVAFTAPREFGEPEQPVEAPPPPTYTHQDVLHTVLVGVPIGDYLPLWQRDGQEDTVTFWRMSDPDAVRARLGTGVESRSAVDTGRYREAAMFSPERQMLFLMDRFRDDSGNLGGTSEQLFPATEEEAYQAADDKALSVLYSWLGDVVLAAVRRGEFVAVETGGWDVPVNPVVLVMLRTDGHEWHSVVETSPVPVGAPVWRDQQPVEGTSQILASPATDQTLRASGLLTRFAINTWSMHPFQLGISFGPNPTLEER
jgi:hypothetical protein